MSEYNLKLSGEIIVMPAYTTSTTLVKKVEQWMTTSEIIQELAALNIKTNRTYLLRKGKSGIISMRTNPMNKKITLFNLQEVLEKMNKSCKK